MRTTRKIAILTSIVLAVFVTVAYAATLNIRRIVNSNAPPPPTNFVVLFNASQPTNVFLSWGNAATNYTAIDVERSTVPGTWVLVTNIIGTNVAFTNLYTWTNTPASYRIRSYFTNGLNSLYTIGVNN